VFEPGSTAKIFAAAALLKHELVGPADSVWGEEGRYRIGTRLIQDEHAEGWMRLSDVIRRSSNIGIAKFASRLSSGQQFEMLRDFGLGSRTGVEFPVESQGLLARPARWTSFSSASLSYGYEMAVTTVQLAAAYAAIANDGVLLQPTLLLSVRAADGEEVYRHRPRPVRRVVSAKVARELRGLLQGAVGEEGTGFPAALVGFEVGGKTGTARRAGSNGQYIPGSCTASFASMFPVDDPQLVMVVKLEGPAPSLDDGVVPYVLDWPLDTSETDQARRQVPPVKGMSLREAARRLHQVGLRVRAVGWGTIDSVAPRAGTPMLPGALVTVVGREGPTRR
jgi:cell division protein FtsI/penicillin-binding protein 2